MTSRSVPVTGVPDQFAGLSNQPYLAALADSLVGRSDEEVGVEDRGDPPSWPAEVAAADEASGEVPSGAEETSADLDPVGDDGGGSYLYNGDEGDGGSEYVQYQDDYSVHTAEVSLEPGYNRDMSSPAGGGASVPPYPAELPAHPVTVGSAGRATATAPPAQPAPAPRTGAAPARRANLVVARFEPWSVMKFSFLMSLVAWVVLFVAVAVLYYALSSLGVFTAIGNTLQTITSSQGSGGVDLSKWTSASRVLGYTMLIGAVNVVVITALSTVGAMIYNLVTHLGGGVEITLRETD